MTAQGAADRRRRPARTIEVVPDGRRVEEVVNGTLDKPADVTLAVPDNAIEGSAKAIVKIYPSSFSQLVEGLDGIFQHALRLLRADLLDDLSERAGPGLPEADRPGRPGGRGKAEDYIHLGYQRLLGFEVAGGGFDWFGRPPANRTLTAYGLMEFRTWPASTTWTRS